MTRETRIAMLVGLLFIILFGLVLSELTGTRPPPAPPVDPTDQRRSYVFVPGGGSDDSDIPFAAEDGPAARGGVGRRVESVTVGPPKSRRRGGRVSVRLSGPPMAAIRARRETGRRSRGPRTYKVRPNDTLIGIARKVYGAEHWRQYRRILAANRDRLADGAMIRVGQVLVIPAPGPSDPREVSLAELPGRLAGRSPPPAGPPRVYVVRPGDSLTKIARRMLDDASRRGVMSIYRANTDKLTSPDELPVGVELRIPPRSGGE